MAEKWIPDFSKWQGNINFALVRTEHDAVILRASCGQTKDDRFDANIKAALANGLKVGVYHYLCGYTPVVAVDECKFFYSVIKPYKDQISFFVLDFEDQNMLKLQHKEKVKLYHAFSDRLRDTYHIENRVLYTWQWLGEELKLIDDKYDFAWEWYADYGTNNGEPNRKVTRGRLHQFTSKSKQSYDQSTYTDMSQIMPGYTLADLCGKTSKPENVQEDVPELPAEGDSTQEKSKADWDGDGRIVRITKGSTWNVRYGNGTNFGVMGTAKVGSEYDYVGTSVNGWMAILYTSDKVGWISDAAAEVIHL